MSEVDTVQKKLDNFFSSYRNVSFKKHEIILQAHDMPSGVYYLEDGYVRHYSTSQDGEELTLLILKPGEFFPTRWTITHEPIEYTIQALTNVNAKKAPKEEFLEFIKSDTEILYEFTRRMLMRLGSLFKRMEYLAFGNAYNKIASILCILGDKFGVDEGNEIIIQIPFTHHDIATLVGITRETASIELEKLRQQGIISFDGKKVVITNLRALKKESLL